MAADPGSYFARLQRGDAELPPITTTLGGAIQKVDLGAGTLASRYVAAPAFLNPAGQVQGGILCAMLDDAEKPMKPMRLASTSGRVRRYSISRETSCTILPIASQ